MKDILLISKILIKNSFSFSNKKKKSLLGNLLVYLILIVYTCSFTYTITKSLAEFEMEQLALNVIFAAVLCLILFQNVISSINMLFFSQDTINLLPLPVSSGKLFIAKLNCLLFTEYISNLLFFLPALITYGVVLNLGWLYYLYTVLIFFVFPILPLAFVVFIMSVIIKFTKLIRNKDAAQYISVIVSLVLIIGITGISSRSSEEISTEELNNMLISVSSLSDRMSNIFITLKPAIGTLTNYNNINALANFLKLVFETVVGYSVFVLIIKKYFIQIILEVNSKGTKTKIIKSDSKTYKKKSLRVSYYKKEILNLLRNSIYCMQCLVPSVLMPLVILIPLAIAIYNGGEEGAELISALGMNKNAFWLGIRLTILQFLYGINFISITSISREGKDVFALKYIPVSYDKQISYKANIGTITNIAPIIWLILFDIIALKTLELDLFIMLFITGIISSIVFNYALVLIDLKHPKLNWDSEYAVVKQNINMIFGLFVATFNCAIIILTAIITQSIYNYFLIITFVFLLLYLLIKLYVKNKSNKLFSKLEV